MSLENEDTDNGDGQEVEQEARLLGWVPEEEFKGAKDNWETAEAFVERGRHLMPILKQNNVRLKNELLTRDQKIGTLQTQLQNAQKAIERLDAHYTEATKRAVTAAKAELVEQLKQARSDGDVDAEIEVQDKLDELKASQAAAEKKEPEEKKPPTTTDLDPQFIEWNQENPWFGDTTNPENKKRTKALVRIAEDLREDGDKTQGRAFFDKCLAMLDGDSADLSTPPNRTARVEGGGGGRSAARAGAKSFASLPAEAKQACMEDAPYLVGKDKKFATQKDWETEYARIYYKDAN